MPFPTTATISSTTFFIALSSVILLSTRETLRLTHVASTAKIGTILGLSRFTVRTHLENIYQKLGVQTRTAAAALAYGESLKPGIGESRTN